MGHFCPPGSGSNPDPDPQPWFHTTTGAGFAKKGRTSFQNLFDILIDLQTHSRTSSHERAL